MLLDLMIMIKIKYIKDTIVINGEKKPLKLMECDFNGILRIFNFHTGDLLYTNSRGNYNGFCYWNDNYFFVPTNYNRLCLVDSSCDKNIKYFNGHKDQITNILKLIHPIFGECLITIGFDYCYFWIINEKSKK